DVEPENIRIGMRVVPVFCDGDGVTLLRYRPADD
ncbi:MAG: acyl dehydratase, partial [Mycobacterium sp.]